MSASTAPVATYVPFRRVGDLLFVSGQLPLRDGGLLAPGTLGRSVGVAEAAEAAAVSAALCLRVAEAAIGPFERIASVVKVTGYVAATADFTEHASVVDAASLVFTDALGAAGEHARVAIGVASLPRGSSVEVEAVFTVA